MDDLVATYKRKKSKSAAAAAAVVAAAAAAASSSTDADAALKESIAKQTAGQSTESEANLRKGKRGGAKSAPTNNKKKPTKPEVPEQGQPEDSSQALDGPEDRSKEVDQDPSGTKEKTDSEYAANDRAPIISHLESSAKGKSSKKKAVDPPAYDIIESKISNESDKSSRVEEIPAQPEDIPVPPETSGTSLQPELKKPYDEDEAVGTQQQKDTTKTLDSGSNIKNSDDAESATENMSEKPKPTTAEGTAAAVPGKEIPAEPTDPLASTPPASDAQSAETAHLNLEADNTGEKSTLDTSKDPPATDSREEMPAQSTDPETNEGPSCAPENTSQSDLAVASSQDPSGQDVAKQKLSMPQAMEVEPTDTEKNTSSKSGDEPDQKSKDMPSEKDKSSAKSEENDGAAADAPEAGKKISSTASTEVYTSESILHREVAPSEAEEKSADKAPMEMSSIEVSNGVSNDKQEPVVVDENINADKADELPQSYSICLSKEGLLSLKLSPKRPINQKGIVECPSVHEKKAHEAIDDGKQPSKQEETGQVEDISNELADSKNSNSTDASNEKADKTTSVSDSKQNTIGTAEKSGKVVEREARPAVAAISHPSSAPARKTRELPIHIRRRGGDSKGGTKRSGTSKTTRSSHPEGQPQSKRQRMEFPAEASRSNNTEGARAAPPRRGRDPPGACKTSSGAKKHRDYYAQFDVKPVRPMASSTERTEMQKSINQVAHAPGQRAQALGPSSVQRHHPSSQGFVPSRSVPGLMSALEASAKEKRPASHKVVAPPKNQPGAPAKDRPEAAKEDRPQVQETKASPLVQASNHPGHREQMGGAKKQAASMPKGAEREAAARAQLQAAAQHRAQLQAALQRQAMLRAGGGIVSIGGPAWNAPAPFLGAFQGNNRAAFAQAQVARRPSLDPPSLSSASKKAVFADGNERDAKQSQGMASQNMQHRASMNIQGNTDNSIYFSMAQPRVPPHGFNVAHQNTVAASERVQQQPRSHGGGHILPHHLLQRRRPSHNTESEPSINGAGNLSFRPANAAPMGASPRSLATYFAKNTPATSARAGADPPGRSSKNRNRH
jgi:hypothetical protein